MSGTGSNADDDVSSFIPTKCPGYRHHIGEGKSPPPTVPAMRYVGDLACTEWEAPIYHTVWQGGGEEAPKAGGGGAVGEYKVGLPGLWITVRDGHLV